MRGINLKEVIRMFGLKDGFSFWFRWNVIDPIQLWYWQNIIHKKYCTNAGYHCKKKDCKYTHLPYFPKQPKIISGDICVFCGEEPAQKVIFSPNDNQTMESFWWKVCNNCDETIQAQNSLSMAISFGNTAIEHKFYDEKVEAHIKEQMNKAKAKIEEIEKRTGKPSLTVQFTKTESGYEARKV